MTFDPSKPHGEVYGYTGVKWEQGGRLYSQDGLEIGAPKPAAEPPPPSGADYSQMHWKKVKALAEQYDFQWTGNVQDAIAFLEGRSAA